MGPGSLTVLEALTLGVQLSVVILCGLLPMGATGPARSKGVQQPELRHARP